MNVDSKVTGRRLRLLALGPQEPWPPTDGGKEGIHGALLALAERAEVRFACPGEPPDASALAHYAEVGVDYRPALFTPRETLALVAKATLQLKPFKFHKYGDSRAEQFFAEAVGDYKPDAIVCFHAHMEQVGQRLNRRFGWNAPILVREHNIEHELVASYLAAMPGWTKPLLAPVEWLTRREEHRIWERADATAFLTDRDFRTAMGSGARGRLVLAPEGVPIPPRRTARHPSSDFRLLLPLNRKAPQSVANLKAFLHDYWASVANHPDLADVVVTITGVDAAQLDVAAQMSPERQAQLRVHALGFLPSLLPAFEQALALVAPTFIGGGIRKKILEGMANQVPVIATDLDIATCDYFQAGANILSLGTPDDFVEHVKTLKQNPAVWHRLSDAGRQTVEDHASWARFADVVMGELQQLVGARRPETARP